MNILRWAVIVGREDELPLGQEPETYEEICRRVDEHRRDDYLLWWSPDIWNSEPYDEDHRTFNLEGELCHRPSQDDSDNFFEPESGDEEPSNSSDVVMEATE